QCVLVFLNGRRAAHEGERSFDAFLVERRGAEEIEIDRGAMAEMERDRGPAIQHERQPGRRREQWPNLLLRLRQTIYSGIKTARHRTIFAAARRGCPGRSRTSGARARIPMIVRRSSPV